MASLRSFTTPLCIAAATLSMATLLAPPPLHAATLQDAKSLARAGRGDDAVAMLTSLVGANPKDAPAQTLLCSVYKSMEKFDEAIHACEAAAKLKPGNSDYQVNLARAYGAKAEHAGPMTGMRLVGHIRGAFENAIVLNPKNVDAMSDLGEFYVEAPGIVGGGTDKAKALAPKLLAVDVARGHRLLAMVAAKDGDYATAEAELQKEMAVSHSPEAYVDVAKYYENRKLWEQAARYAVQAIEVDTKHGADSIDAANMLLHLGRNLDVAEKAYRDFLSSAYLSVGSPAFVIHTKLGDLLTKRGDRDGAKKEYNAALALVHDYAPARKGLNT